MGFPPQRGLDTFRKNLAAHVAAQANFLDTKLKPCLDAAQAAEGHVYFVDAAHFEVIHDFGAKLEPLRPTSRARKQATLASFPNWAHRQGFIASDAMRRPGPWHGLRRLRGGGTL